MFLEDRSPISSERTYTDEGFLVVPARISRTGIQEYLAVEMGLTDRDPNDIIRVYRPEEEVFSDLSLSSRMSAENRFACWPAPKALLISLNPKSVKLPLTLNLTVLPTSPIPARS